MPPEPYYQRDGVTLYCGDNREVLPALDVAVSAVVTDPPYGLEFMGKEWDKIGTGRKNNPMDPHDKKFSKGGFAQGNGYSNRETPTYDRKKMPKCAKCGKWQYNASATSQCSCDAPEFVTDTSSYPRKMQEWHQAWAEVVLDAMLPGAHLLAFGGTRTFHRLACAIEDAGFEIRDTLMWVYGCLSDDTEILVDGEWVPYHKAAPGRTALCYNTDSNTYEWLPIEELLTYDYRDTAYRIRSDSTDQLVSRNHRCLVERGGAYVFRYAETLDAQVHVPVLEDMRGLLAALPVPRSQSGQTQENVLIGLPQGDAERSTEGQGQAARGAARHGAGIVRGLRGAGLALSFARQAPRAAVLFLAMQWGSAWAGVGEARAQGPCSVDRREPCVLPREDDRRAQPSMEGRRHVLQDARQLYRRAVRAVSRGIPGYGAQGWVRDGAPAPGSAGDRASVTPIRGRASQRPRPGEQQPRQPATVREQPQPQAVRASRFTRSDLATVEPVDYEGVVWCVRVPTGAFVARRNGKVFVTGNSGFPKSLAVDKAIDKINANPGRELKFTEWMRTTGLSSSRINELTGTYMGGHYTTAASQPAVATREHFEKMRPHITVDIPAWVEELIDRVEAEREVIGNDTKARSTSGKSALPTMGGETVYESWDITAPATPEAERWQGWGTALKPAYEPIIMARKPFPGTVASNVLTHGTGAINVDGCRIGTTEELGRNNPNGPYTSARTWNTSITPGQDSTGKTAGRWPPNVLMDESAAALLDAMSGERGSSLKKPYGNQQRGGTGPIYGDFKTPGEVFGYYDTGGASRFMAVLPVDEPDTLRFAYVSKASRRERNAGLEGMPAREQAQRYGSVQDARPHTSEGYEYPRNPVANSHPTVKPLALMRWLLTLVTPPGGVVLDPFAGSGSTLVAAAQLGIPAIGIEMDPEYCEIAARRIDHALNQRALGVRFGNGTAPRKRDRTEYGLSKSTRSQGATYGKPSPSADFDATKGRWPSNVLMDQAAADALDAMSGERKGDRPNRRPRHNGAFKSVAKGAETARDSFGHSDTGGASRFMTVLDDDAPPRQLALEAD